LDADEIAPEGNNAVMALAKRKNRCLSFRLNPAAYGGRQPKQKSVMDAPFE
jgi:hypothetical protein